MLSDIRGQPIAARPKRGRRQGSTSAIISHHGTGYDVGFVDRFWTTVRDESLVSPDAWFHHFALLSRPGDDAVQIKYAGCNRFVPCSGQR
jgi:hypothetical protein